MLSSSKDNSYNEYQTIARDEMKIDIHVSLKRKNYVVSIEDEEQHSKKAKFEERLLSTSTALVFLGQHTSALYS
jgi:hypothetical protein